MSFTTAFKGKIQAHGLKTANKTWVLPFDVSPASAPCLQQTLMTNFKNLKLNDEEKRQFSQKCREEIVHYQNLQEESLFPYVEKLLTSIHQSNQTELRIVAQDLGAFICLAAIYSGRLPQNKVLIFELSDAPISLFPKKWIRETKQAKAVEIHFQLHSSWLTSFQTLAKCPAYINTNLKRPRAA